MFAKKSRVMSDWEVYQDSPTYGCDDNPSYKWYGYITFNGHIQKDFGPFDSKAEAVKIVKENL